MYFISFAKTFVVARL